MTQTYPPPTYHIQGLLLTGNMNDITTIIRSAKGGRCLLQEGHADSAAHAVSVARFVAREDMKQQCLCVGLALLLPPRPGGTRLEVPRQTRQLLRIAVASVHNIATRHRCCRGTGSYNTLSGSATTPHSSPVDAARGGAATAAATHVLVLRGSEGELPSNKLRGLWQGFRWESRARREEEQGGRKVASRREVRVGRWPDRPHTPNPLAADRAHGNKKQTCGPSMYAYDECSTSCSTSSTSVVHTIMPTSSLASLKNETGITTFPGAIEVYACSLAASFGTPRQGACCTA